jgi:hypothetical protein
MEMNKVVVEVRVSNKIGRKYTDADPIIAFEEF